MGQISSSIKRLHGRVLKQETSQFDSLEKIHGGTFLGFKTHVSGLPPQIQRKKHPQSWSFPKFRYCIGRYRLNSRSRSFSESFTGNDWVVWVVRPDRSPNDFAAHHGSRSPPFSFAPRPRCQRMGSCVMPGSGRVDVGSLVNYHQAMTMEFGKLEASPCGHLLKPRSTAMQSEICHSSRMVSKRHVFGISFLLSENY